MLFGFASFFFSFGSFSLAVFQRYLFLAASPVNFTKVLAAPLLSKPADQVYLQMFRAKAIQTEPTWPFLYPSVIPGPPHQSGIGPQQLNSTEVRDLLDPLSVSPYSFLLLFLLLFRWADLGGTLFLSPFVRHSSSLS